MAIAQLSNRGLSSLEKIRLGREFRVSKWLSEGVEALSHDAADLKIEAIADAIGWETTARVFSARDAARGLVAKELTTDGESVPLSKMRCIGCQSPPTSTSECECGGLAYTDYEGAAVFMQRISGFKIDNSSETQAKLRTALELELIERGIKTLFENEVEELKRAEEGFDVDDGL